ncbi:restriction endonuclease [Halalkalibacter sp. APA_J-10(15)]|nr:restriction endonuclease [Halalkalibacter sp. APA_J-10(15)]
MKKTDKRKWSYSPILLFLITYLIVQLYHINFFLLCIPLSLTILLIIISFFQRQLRLHTTKREHESKNTLKKEDFKQLLSFLFKKQGYSVSNVKGRPPIADLILRKKGLKATVHLISSKELFSTSQLKQLHENRIALNAHQSFIVTNQHFSQEVKKEAIAQKFILMDYDTVEEMLSSIATEKRKHRFIFRVRSLLTKY